MRARTLLLLPTAAAVALAGAALAGAGPPNRLIVLDRSLGGITLGMSHTQVVAIAGKPDREITIHGSLESSYDDTVVAGITRTVAVWYDRNKVDAIGTDSPRYHHGKLHVGITRRQALTLGFHPVCNNYPGKLDDKQWKGANTLLTVFQGRVNYIDVEINTGGCPN